MLGLHLVSVTLGGQFKMSKGARQIVLVTLHIIILSVVMDVDYISSCIMFYLHANCVIYEICKLPRPNLKSIQQSKENPHGKFLSSPCNVNHTHPTLTSI